MITAGDTETNIRVEDLTAAYDRHPVLDDSDAAGRTSDVLGH